MRPPLETTTKLLAPLAKAFQRRVSRTKEIAVVGAGGHGASTLELVESMGTFRIVGLFDDFRPQGFLVRGYEVLGTVDQLSRKPLSAELVAIGLGHTPKNNPRVEVVKRLQRAGYSLPILISPHAQVSKFAGIGKGASVHAGCVVNAGAVIGEFSIINSGAIVEHDVVVGSNCHIAPGAIILGGARIGDQTFVGAGAIVFPNVDVASGSIVPAGSVTRS